LAADRAYLVDRQQAAGPKKSILVVVVTTITGDRLAPLPVSP
jgi:hypothetical protein